MIAENMPFNLGSIFVLLLLSLTFETTHSCSCLPLPEDLTEYFERAKLVFIGEATKIDYEADNLQIRILFKVREIFKGGRTNVNEYTVFTNIDSAACGVPVVLGDVWQVWASGDDDHLGFSSCGASTKDIERSIEFLRERRESS